MLRQARAVGHLPGRWVTADEAFGQVPTFRDDLETDGWWYVLEVPAATPVFTRITPTAVPAWSGRGRTPTRVRVAAGAPPAAPLAAVAAALPDAAWTTVTVADGAQGPRTYQFWAQRGWESRDGVPGRATWLVVRRNLDGSEVKYYLSNAPADTPLATLAWVGAMRWPVETEFETAKGETGLDEYEVRSWAGWHHHITLALLAGAFLLQLQQDWGKKAPHHHPSPTHPRAAGTAAPADLQPGRPVAVALRHGPPQRARQSGPCQTPRPSAA